MIQQIAENNPTLTQALELWREFWAEKLMEEERNDEFYT